MVVAKESNYEEFRQKRVEENKKRMEALNLPKLCQNLSPIKTSPMKKRSIPRTPEKQMVIVRRSSRLSSSSSTIDYREIDVKRVQIQRRGVGKRRDLSNRVYVSEECREEAISRAEKLQADLGSDHPSFVKSMLQSHVSGGFWLGLPVQFCRSQLQKQDGVITLIDEEGEEFETIYLARKTGLSGGWMGFAVAHNLAYGDALVFQLIRPSTFKVYITRVGSSEESSKI